MSRRSATLGFGLAALLALGPPVVPGVSGPAARAEDGKTTFALFGRGGGHAWRAAVPSLAKASLVLEPESGPGTIEWDAAKDAERYIVYLFERAPTVEKGAEETFWKGGGEGFLIGAEVVPRPGAARFSILDSNKKRAWTHAYVFAVEGKERRLLPKAEWKADTKEPGADGTTLPARYRTPGG